MCASCGLTDMGTKRSGEVEANQGDRETVALTRLGCKRLVRTRWPGVTELGDVTKITDKTSELLNSSIGCKVDVVCREPMPRPERAAW